MIIISFCSQIPSQTIPDSYVESWDGKKGKEVPCHE